MIDSYITHPIMYKESTAMDALIFLACVSIVSALLDNVFINIDSIPTRNNYIPRKKYRPVYHITAMEGWLSYPTGFTKYRGQYHVFYQYQQSNALNRTHWGHVVSENLIDWFQYPTAVVPKADYDKQACLGGSAVQYKNRLALFYTGHVVAEKKNIETQNLAISGDGMLFQKYLLNPLIKAPEQYNTAEFRDPKVWRHNNTWYMLVGTSSKQGKGELVLYTSTDIFQWNYHGVVVKAFEDMGSLWENPDIIEISGRHILILSIRGMKSEEYRFQNLHQTGYVVTSFNYNNNRFEDLELSRATFHQLDYGHDFYAAKTMTSYDGRKLLIAWLGMAENDYSEAAYGWASMLTLIREIRLSKFGILLMTPIREMQGQRVEILDKSLYNPGESFIADTKYFELVVKSTSFVDTYLGLMFGWENGNFSIEYSALQGHISINRGGVNGLRRASWSPMGKISLRIFVDYSSIEIFCGDGEIVFSSRIYPKAMSVHITGQSQVYVAQYKLGKTKAVREIHENVKTIH